MHVVVVVVVVVQERRRKKEVFITKANVDVVLKGQAEIASNGENWPFRRRRLQADILS